MRTEELFEELKRALSEIADHGSITWRRARARDALEAIDAHLKEPVHRQYISTDDAVIEAAYQRLDLSAIPHPFRASIAFEAGWKAAQSNEPVQDSQAEQVCYEAYQAVGSMLSDLGWFGTAQATKLLDNLSQARMVHEDVLPWPSFKPQTNDLPEHGTSADFAEAADLVDKLGKATTKGEMLSLVLGYRKQIRAAALPQEGTHNMTTTLGDALPLEIERCERILANAVEMGAAGGFLTLILTRSLQQARAAVLSGDAVAMVRAYSDLKEYRE